MYSADVCEEVQEYLGEHQSDSAYEHEEVELHNLVFNVVLVEHPPCAHHIIHQYGYDE